MLQLFVAPTPFEGWGERAYDGTSQRQLLAVLIVSVGALALTLCVGLLMLFPGEPPWALLIRGASLYQACLISVSRRMAAEHSSRPCTFIHNSRLVEQRLVTVRFVPNSRHS